MRQASLDKVFLLANFQQNNSQKLLNKMSGSMREQKFYKLENKVE
jgi:hypothetical protein